MRSTCFKNWMPRPAPSLAPGMRPGMSAMTKFASSSIGDDAEVRHERRERIVGDLRPRARHGADERALAHVRKAEQADVGHHLELERASISAPSSPGSARRGARSYGVAKWMLPRPPFPPRATTVRTFGSVEIEEQLAARLVEDLRADGHADDELLAARCRTVFSAPGLAGFRLECVRVGEVEQRRESRGRSRRRRRRLFRRRRPTGRRTERTSPVETRRTPCRRARRRFALRSYRRISRGEAII